MSTANDYPHAILKFQTVCGLVYMVGDKSLQCEQCVWYNLTRITASSRFPVPENLTNSIQYLCCKLLLWWCCCENIAHHIELKTGMYITWQQKICTLTYNLLTTELIHIWEYPSDALVILNWHEMSCIPIRLKIALLYRFVWSCKKLLKALLSYNLRCKLRYNVRCVCVRKVQLKLRLK